MKTIASSLLSRTLLTSIIGAGALFLSSQTGFCAYPAWVTWETSAGGNGHQYLAVPGSDGLTWNVANTLAQAQGGYLATINSAAENNFVFGLVNSSQFFTAFNGSGPALGGFNAGTPANPAWSWVTAEPFGFTDWLPGSPDYAFNGTGPEDRLHYFSNAGSTPDNRWNDIQQNDTNLGGYVVEVVPEPSSLAILGCASLLFARRFTAKRK